MIAPTLPWSHTVDAVVVDHAELSTSERLELKMDRVPPDLRAPQLTCPDAVGGRAILSAWSQDGMAGVWQSYAIVTPEGSDPIPLDGPGQVYVYDPPSHSLVKVEFYVEIRRELPHTVELVLLDEAGHSQRYGGTCTPGAAPVVLGALPPEDVTIPPAPTGGGEPNVDIVAVVEELLAEFGQDTSLSS